MRPRVYCFPLFACSLLLFGANLFAQDKGVHPLKVQFSKAGGFYQQEVMVALSVPLGGGTIYYTADGSLPSEKSSYRYQVPIRIQRTTVIRAFAVVGRHKGKETAQTYFVNEPPSTLPVLSIASTPGALFDPDKGLFMDGNHVLEGPMKQGANFWFLKELMVHFEIYEPNGECVFSSRTGMRMFGGNSRLFPQKSLAIIVKKKYGEDAIRHPIFGAQGLKKFKYLVLRNSGSDWGKSHFRDALSDRLSEGLDVDHQAYQPARVYINGKYWGIFNMREKINREYLSKHHKVGKDDFDLIEHLETVHSGTLDGYRGLVQRLEQSSLADSATYEWFKTQVDVDNFMNYNIIESYCGNTDMWLNVKYWRLHSPEGRWRWLLYDTDFGFGLHDSTSYKVNMFPLMTQANGTTWPNPPWSTFMFRKATESGNFNRHFVNRCADFLNTNYEPNHVIAVIDSFQQQLQPEMKMHLHRWNLSEKEWLRQVSAMRSFARLRPDYMRQHLSQFFGVGNVVTLQTTSGKGGRIVVNDNLTIRDTFEGKYFEGCPILLRAVPEEGYAFDHWQAEGGLTSTKRVLKLAIKGGLKVKAVFKEYEALEAEKVVINEVSVNDRESGDWVELYNRSGAEVNLSGWTLENGKSRFKIPSLTLQSKDYLILCRDSSMFMKKFPRISNMAGNLPFGCKKVRDELFLYSNEEVLIDRAKYDVEPSDSIYTVQLLTPTSDNADCKNWVICDGHGTPGAANTIYATGYIRNRQDWWVRIGAFLGLGLIGGWALRERYRGVKFEVGRSVSLKSEVGMSEVRSPKS